MRGRMVAVGRYAGVVTRRSVRATVLAAALIAGCDLDISVPLTEIPEDHVEYAE